MITRRHGRALEQLTKLVEQAPQRMHECWSRARGIRELSNIALEVIRANLDRVRGVVPKHWTDSRTRDG